MNSTLLIAAGLLLYFVLYHTYGKYLKRSVVGEPTQEVPSKRLYDGVDYVPANRYVLFGHHFASVAGAAPIVGPAIALAWGWFPALAWVWLGNIFIGAVHDYLSLMSSVRYDGHSVQWIAGKIIRKRTGYAFAWFIFFVLILVVAAFGAVLGKLFVKQPAVPTSYILKIGAALILGVLLYRVKMNFRLATVIGIIMLIAAIYFGKMFPIKAGYKTWLAVFFVYIIVAASIPVHVLLQPRDYLNAWLLVGGLIIGGIAILFSFKAVTMPAVTVYSAPIIGGKPTPFWPVIPLIIACGSLSGFHAIVASGTSSKQLSSEEDGLFVGYGGMLTEGFLSTLVVVAIATFGMKVLSPEKTAALAGGASAFANNYIGAAKSVGGPVGIFSKSYAEAANSVLGLPKEFMVILASMWVASFAMTTLDTTNRLARYTFSEIFEPFKDTSPGFYGFITNRWVASAIPAFIGIGLAWTGAWTVIWPAFGGANQMLASIALMTGAAWAIRVQKAKGMNVLIPALFLWVTVTLAMIWYLIVAVPTFYAKNPVQAVILGAIMVVMLALNFLLIYDFYKPEEKVVGEPEVEKGS
ncbi:MAG: carbon starvation protein A [Deltaproteobacteria bacterium]|nr:MAG: carbon starvation protein A [Deltaproteobacteria bacterium]